MTTNQTADDPENQQDQQYETNEGTIRPSIVVKLIRHAESANNTMYRDARFLYRGGTAEFDEEGWNQYVDSHRSSDPHISELGRQQAQKLADYLVPHLSNQASQPLLVITSPMRRTLETIRPTLHGLAKIQHGTSVLVNGFYHESEGCHTKDTPEEGMNPREIETVLRDGGDDSNNSAASDNGDSFASMDFTGFPSDPERGWYYGAKGAETRADSETRAAKFYLWLCEYLDEQLQGRRTSDASSREGEHHDVFDAGVAIPGEEHEDEHDKMQQRHRKRRTCLLVGHGDFMSLVLKRVVAGFGHYVEQEGIPHRAAFVHFNTGITEVEYFGQGRFLVMGHNMTPHFSESEYSKLRSGGSLKDGWSYLVPNEPLYSEVKVAFDDDELDEHVREQTQALKALYLKSESTAPEGRGSTDSSLQVEGQKTGKVKHFIVNRGLQVVGCATLQEDTGVVSDIAIRPSAGPGVMDTLMKAVKDHTKTIGRSGSLLVFPRPGESREVFEEYGFTEVDESKMVMKD